VKLAPKIASFIEKGANGSRLEEQISIAEGIMGFAALNPSYNPAARHRPAA